MKTASAKSPSVHTDLSGDRPALAGAAVASVRGAGRSIVGAPALLNAGQAAQYLGVGRTTFYALRPRLIAAGMQIVKVPSRGATPTRRYTRASLDRLIDRAAQRGTHLC